MIKDMKKLGRHRNPDGALMTATLTEVARLRAQFVLPVGAVR